MQENAFSYRLIRSQRRTLSLELDKDGGLTARAPLHMQKTEIESYIEQKADWIARTRRRLAQQRKATDGFRLSEGAQLPYLGGTLQIRMADVPFGMDYHGWLLLPRTSDIALSAFQWRGERARTLLAPRVAAWSRLTGIQLTSLTITSPRGRWGSMSSAGRMRLNAALMHCAPDMIDYVIVHELCHRREMNHSPAFHALIARWIPNENVLLRRMKVCASYTGLLRGPVDKEDCR